MKLGLSTYTFGWAVGISDKKHSIKAFNELDLLEKTKQHGLHLVQIGDNLPLHEMNEERLGLFKQKAIELGISLETGARKLTEENLELYLRITERLNAGLLRFVVDGQEYEPALDRVIDIIKNIVPALEKKKITLGLENH